MAKTHIGIDVGGSGVKAGLVDVDAGHVLGDRLRIKTPQPATPDAVVDSIAELVGQLDSERRVGLGFPAVVRDGVVSTANNIDPGWIGLNARDLVEQRLGREVTLINDADAAGVAEVAFGAARSVDGTVLVLTFGTGVGSALIANGELMPNLELGQIEFSGVRPAELKYSAKARRREDLDWDAWGRRANEFLSYVNSVFNPSLMVVGGGIVKHWDLFEPMFDGDLPLAPAKLLNNAGIVGAAYLASIG